MQSEERILGVEGGGTKTTWVLVQHNGEEMHVLEQGRLPPSNLRLTSPERLREIFQEFPRPVHRAGVFLAGCVTDEDKALLARLCNETWPGARIVTGSDRESGMAAALGNADGIVVNAGSGSSVTGRRDGRLEKAGGWGHILGDAGGAYFLVVQALRLILREYRPASRRSAVHREDSAGPFAERSRSACALGPGGGQNGGGSPCAGRF